MPRIELSGVTVDRIHGTGWLMDFKAENDNQLGHYGWEIAEDELFLHESFGFKEGETVTVEMNGVDGDFAAVSSYLIREMDASRYNMSFGDFWAAIGTLRGMWRMSAPFKVAGVFSTSMGKFPEG